MASISTTPPMSASLAHLTVQFARMSKFVLVVLMDLKEKLSVVTVFRLRSVWRSAEMEKDSSLPAMMEINGIMMDVIVIVRLRKGGLVRADHQ